MKKLLLLACVFALSKTWAQQVAEVTGLRFYEHHSTDMTGEPFGNSADGSKSGYDFVKRQYQSSFNPANMDAYLNGEEQNLDMVEHNGPFGTQGTSMYLGFTAGVSTIWGGPIKGNSKTKWHKVTAGVSAYTSALTNQDLKSLYDSTKATLAIGEVKANEVYVGRIRNGNLYVLIKITAAQPATKTPNGTNEDNIFFTFDYKISTPATGLLELGANINGNVFPNPANNNLTIKLNEQITGNLQLTDITGKLFMQQNITSNATELNTTELPNGVYFLRLTSATSTAVQRIVISH